MSVMIVSPYLSLLTRCKPHSGLEGGLEVISEHPSGTGIDLARLLKKQDIKAKFDGFLGGHTGYRIRAMCRKERLPLYFLKVSSESPREISIDNKPSQTLITPLTPAHWETLYKALEGSEKKVQVIVAINDPRLPFPREFLEKLKLNFVTKNPSHQFLSVSKESDLSEVSQTIQYLVQKNQNKLYKQSVAHATPASSIPIPK